MQLDMMQMIALPTPEPTKSCMVVAKKTVIRMEEQTDHHLRGVSNCWISESAQSFAADDFSKANKPAYKLRYRLWAFGRSKQSSAQITTALYEEKCCWETGVGGSQFSPRQMANFISEVLVLGVLNADNAVVLLQPQSAIVNGTW
jgi:tRNA-binding protein